MGHTMTARIPIPTYDGGPDSGTRNDRADYLEPMAERWPGGDLLSLVEWLGVESSLRWQPRKRADGTQATYCDHYAADLIEQACGQQLISAWVWWTEAALRRLELGEKVEPVYGKTILEHGAKGLHGWMIEHGQKYGWSRVYTDAALRDMVTDRHTIGLILTPSHVSVALPDTYQPAPFSGPPLQTQAGSRNVKLWRQDDWYRRRTDTVRVWLDPHYLVNVKRPA